MLFLIKYPCKSSVDLKLLRIAESSYQIRWEERTGHSQREEWIAVVEIKILDAQHRRASNPNPLGIYVTHFNWVLQGAQEGGPS